MSRIIHFLLNDKEVKVSAPSGLLVLDYLRQNEKLVGTKEGCKEGDCGACMVLLGELRGDRVEYKPMTSCLVPLGELHGKHLVTVEGVNLDSLSPVQKAIVDEGGSQCGFCTPGIVVSLTACLMRHGAEIDDERIKYALGGNLCRCTGYASLLRAGARLAKSFGNGSNFKAKLNSGEQVVSALVESKALPDYFEKIPARLSALPRRRPTNGKVRSKYFVAGGTDIYVQKGDSLADLEVGVLNLHPQMKGIERTNGHFRVGALTTFEEFADSPDIQKIIPDIKQFMHLNAAWQIRNRATLGGNIVNASPIGDMTVLLLALDSDLVLQKAKSRRVVPMKTFFKGYKKLDKKPNEILTEILFPVPTPETKIHFEKVSKRKTLDIASVNSASRIRVQKGTIEDVDLTMGGVAPIPLWLAKTSAFLLEKPVNRETVLEAVTVALSEISPISDVRGSAEYKRLLMRQFLIAHFTKLFPDYVSVRGFYEAH